MNVSVTSLFKSKDKKKTCPLDNAPKGHDFYIMMNKYASLNAVYLAFTPALYFLNTLLKQLQLITTTSSVRAGKLPFLFPLPR